uniref:OMP640 n=1 Tax=Helicobacter acinonychis TaxID=212 RepID=A0A1M4NFH6_HELAC|nr:OMP954 [Helicobacter acinonychis]SFZ70590.1 OMP640 [Helicobacter acinonychis]SFZ70923.1 OMP807 [Helicobacter acinonychis]
MSGASQVNNFTYGVGFDALYNFYESKKGYNTAELFSEHEYKLFPNASPI